MKKLEQEKDKKIQKLQNDLENLKNSQVKQVATNNNNNIYKTNDKEVNTLLVSVPLNSLFTEQELNSMDYEDALKYLDNKFETSYLVEWCKNKLVEHNEYIKEYGIDMPDIINWTWNSSMKD